MPISKKHLTELQAIRDEEIDTSGIPELDELFWFVCMRFRLDQVT